MYDGATFTLFDKHIGVKSENNCLLLLVKQGVWAKCILKLSAMEKWMTPSVFHQHITFYLIPGKTYIHSIHKIFLFFYLLLSNCVYQVLQFVIAVIIRLTTSFKRKCN